MTGWPGRLRPRRPLMLRTRFTLAAAGAVAAVTLAVTAVAFLVLRSDLQDQVQQQLRQQSDVVFRVAQHFHGHIPAGWVPPHSDRFGVSSPYAQVVTSSGAVWAPPDEGGLLAADTAAKQVAAGVTFVKGVIDAVAAKMMKMNFENAAAIAQVIEAGQQNLGQLANVAAGVGQNLDISV